MSKFTLKTISELQAQISTLNDESYGLSFLFYSLVQGNTMSYKGTSATVVKRLVGNKLFDLVPMASFKKGDDKKAVYQYRITGSNKMRDILDNTDHSSISELLGLEIGQGNEYFDTFCEKVEAYFKAIAAEKKSAKESEKEKLDNQFAAYTANPSNANVKRDVFDERLANLSKKEKALVLLKEAGDTEIVALLQEVIDNETAELSGGVAEPMSAESEESEGVVVVG